jgi:diketogulonate reductase-like aldo/keto reductase
MLNREFPIVGLGSVYLRDELTEILPKGFENGYCYFDTSDTYNNEVEFGKAVSKFKNDVIISTKFSKPARVFSLKPYFEIQEAKLGKIDIYLIHWPYPFMWKRMYREMEELVLGGKVKHIGVCNFTDKHLEKLYQFCKIKPYVLQTEISPLYQQVKTVEFCWKNNLHIINYSPLAHNNERIYNNETIQCIAQKYNQSIHNIVLRWSIQKGFTPLVRTAKQSHLVSMNPENLMSFELENQEMEYIDSLGGNIKIWSTPEKRFSIKQKLKFLLIRLISWIFD